MQVHNNYFIENFLRFLLKSVGDIIIHNRNNFSTGVKSDENGKVPTMYGNKLSSI